MSKFQVTKNPYLEDKWQISSVSLRPFLLVTATLARQIWSSLRQDEKCNNCQKRSLIEEEQALKGIGDSSDAIRQCREKTGSVRRQWHESCDRKWQEHVIMSNVNPTQKCHRNAGVKQKIVTQNEPENTKSNHTTQYDTIWTHNYLQITLDAPEVKLCLNVPVWIIPFNFNISNFSPFCIWVWKKQHHNNEADWLLI